MNAPRQTTSIVPEEQAYTSGSSRISLYKRGARKYEKMSYPLHAGIFTEVETPTHLFHFNLNNEIIRVKAKGDLWRHPHEWLKRNVGNDWIYYSTGGYTGVFETTGEYYLPNMPYVTNGLIGGNPFELDEVNALITTWPILLTEIKNTLDKPPEAIQDFFELALANTPDRLGGKADTLFSICGGRSTVLPPDARHVDYNVIPVTIASGCLYKCSFCEVKNKKNFSPKDQKEITDQIDNLTRLYDEDLPNYNAVFLGEHDALQRGAESILQTLEDCYRSFRFGNTYLPGCNAYLFGSATSLMNCPDSLFADLEHLPFSVAINIGLESADQETLDLLGKPLTTSMVKECFTRIQDINDRFSKTEVTANFVFDDNLPENHVPSFLDLVRDSLPHAKPKGCIYLSPLKFGHPSRAQTFVFNRLKVLSRVPTFLYIIQRL